MRQARLLASGGGKSKGKGKGKSKGYGKKRRFVAVVDEAGDDDELPLDEEEEYGRAYAADLIPDDGGGNDDWGGEDHTSAGENEQSALAAFLSAKQRLARVKQQTSALSFSLLRDRHY